MTCLRIDRRTYNLDYIQSIVWEWNDEELPVVKKAHLFFVDRSDVTISGEDAELVWKYCSHNDLEMIMRYGRRNIA